MRRVAIKLGWTLIPLGAFAAGLASPGPQTPGLAPIDTAQAGQETDRWRRTRDLAPGDVVGCGYIIDTMCPGFTPQQPADATCFCDYLGIELSGSCKCVKLSGGQQTGIIVMCFANSFLWQEAHPGHEIKVGEPRLCSLVAQCISQRGNLCTGTTDCLGKGCLWTDTMYSNATTFIDTQTDCE